MEKTIQFIFACATLSVFVLIMTMMPLHLGARQHEIDQARGCLFVDYVKAEIAKSNSVDRYQWIDFTALPSDAYWHGAGDARYLDMRNTGKGLLFGASDKLAEFQIDPCVDRPAGYEIARRLAREALPLDERGFALEAHIEAAWVTRDNHFGGAIVHLQPTIIGFEDVGSPQRIHLSASFDDAGWTFKEVHQ